MSRSLDAEAEKIRKEIKQMIPETASEENKNTRQTDSLRSKDGRIMYAGTKLGNKVVELRDYLNIGTELGWTLWHFPTAKELVNDNNSMYLVPLSSGSSLTPGGALAEGHLIYVTDKPSLSPGATVIIYMK